MLCLYDIIQNDRKVKFLSKESQQALVFLISTTNHMSGAISNLLDLSIIPYKEIKRENINLSEIVQDYLKEIIRGSTRKIDLIIQPDCFEYADKRFVQIMVHNLLRNAWKYTSNRELSRIEFGHSDGVSFIKDNGVGFDTSKATKIFEPFQRFHSNKEFKGSGLGLSIAKRAVEKHGGKIWVEAEVGKGATFFFSLTERLGQQI